MAITDAENHHAGGPATESVLGDKSLRRKIVRHESVIRRPSAGNEPRRLRFGADTVDTLARGLSNSINADLFDLEVPSDGAQISWPREGLTTGWDVDHPRL